MSGGNAKSFPAEPDGAQAKNLLWHAGPRGPADISISCQRHRTRPLQLRALPRKSTAREIRVSWYAHSPQLSSSPQEGRGVTPGLLKVRMRARLDDRDQLVRQFLKIIRFADHLIAAKA